MAPGFTETIYGRGIGPFFASLLSNISGIIPVSLAEILVVVFVARQLSGAIKGFSEIRNDDRQFTNAVLAGVLRLGADLPRVTFLCHICLLLRMLHSCSGR